VLPVDKLVYMKLQNRGEEVHFSCKPSSLNWMQNHFFSLICFHHQMNRDKNSVKRGFTILILLTLKGTIVQKNCIQLKRYFVDIL